MPHNYRGNTIPQPPPSTRSKRKAPAPAPAPAPEDEDEGEDGVSDPQQLKPETLAQIVANLLARGDIATEHPDRDLDKPLVCLLAFPDSLAARTLLCPPPTQLTDVIIYSLARHAHYTNTR